MLSLDVSPLDLVHALIYFEALFPVACVKTSLPSGFFLRRGGVCTQAIFPAMSLDIHLHPALQQKLKKKNGEVYLVSYFKGTMQSNLEEGHPALVLIQ